MGRIKTTLVKRTSRHLVETLPDTFAKDFESNKKALGNTTMPSKRMRNMIAGYVTRLKRNSQKIIDDQPQE